MPELPEVETVRRIMRRVLQGHTIADVEIVPDDIVMGSTPPEAFVAALRGRTVTEVGRKGKYWWIELDAKPWVFGHLGMAGWIREIGAQGGRLREHGSAPLDDAAGRPRFLKLLLTTDEGKQISFTDQRRLARLWLADSPEKDGRVQRLGFDCLNDIPPAVELRQLLQRRAAPIKAVLLDQAVFAGVGNWIADEVLYQSRLSPKRVAKSLTLREVGALRDALESVVAIAVDAKANADVYPETWIFSSRWGGKRDRQEIGGQTIVREPVGGRTTAWVPTLQL